MPFRKPGNLPAVGIGKGLVNAYLVRSHRDLNDSPGIVNPDTDEMDRIGFLPSVGRSGEPQVVWLEIIISSPDRIPLKLLHLYPFFGRGLAVYKNAEEERYGEHELHGSFRFEGFQASGLFCHAVWRSPVLT